MTHNDTHASWIVECTFCTNMLYSFPKQVSEWEHSALVSAYLCRNAACMRFCFVYFILPPCTLSIFIPYRLSAHDRQKREKQFVIISPMGYVAKIKVTTPTERWKSSFMCCFFFVPFELEKQRKITKHKWWRQWMCGIKCHVGSDSQSKWKHTMPLPLQMKIENRKKEKQIRETNNKVRACGSTVMVHSQFIYYFSHTFREIYRNRRNELFS